MRVLPDASVPFRSPSGAVVAHVTLTPVKDAESASTVAAKQAMHTEWTRLRGTHVSEDVHPGDWYDVCQLAKDGTVVVHLRCLCGICVDKNSELAAQLRKFKGPRCVPGESGV